MSADSGAIFYEKDIHQHYYLANIIEILTVLTIIERCRLDGITTFPYNAVRNIKSGSTSVGYGAGDKITIREALYALLLRLINEATNASAERCAGSREVFTRLMNKKTTSLGCRESHFMNPPGLDDENRYTTTYGYSLIAMAAFKSPTFTEFDSTTYYKLLPNSTNVEPFTIYCGYKMLRKSSDLYYPGIIDDKTDYTMTAGNTFVVCAERDNLKLTTVILNGHLTHYSDTKKLLGFGFANFKVINPESTDNYYEKLQTDLDPVGHHKTLLSLSGGKAIALPKTTQFSDTTNTPSYEPPSDTPKNAVVQIRHLYGERAVDLVWFRVTLLDSGSKVSTSSNARAFCRLRYCLTSLPLPLAAAIDGPILLLLLLLSALCRYRWQRAAAGLAFSHSMNRVADHESFNRPKELSDSASSLDRYLGNSPFPRCRRRPDSFSRLFRCR